MDTKALRCMVVVAATSLAAGCASDYMKVAPQPPQKYAKLGKASGQACGAMLVYATAYNFIPALLNSRVERAYAAALKSVPGAVALVDVEMDEEWYWFILGTMRCVNIRGEAIG